MDYNTLKVVELKELLKERGVSVVGKKQTLVDALNDYDAENGGDELEDDTKEDDVKAAAEKEEQDAPKTRSTRAKRKATSPVPAVPAKPPKKAKADSVKIAIKTVTPTIKTVTPTTKTAAPTTKTAPADAQFVPAGATLDIPVDDGVEPGYHVFVDPNSGIIYDASLNQTNATNNNNKFYRVQLLELNHLGRKLYNTWTRWGRVGERGQNATLGDGSFEEALSNFQKKFKDKSGLSWDNRLDNPKPKKYVFVERSYLADEDELAAQAGASHEDEDGPPAYTAPKCTLAPPVQSLMELIFNLKHFATTMQSLNYDVNKLPLGKLSKSTITRGFEILKELSLIMDDTSIALNADERYEELSNQYFSYIPHAFGRNRPPVIRNIDLLKPEIELLDSLSELKDADEILKKCKESASQIHPLDSRFQGLGMQEMTALVPSSSEFSEIHQYLNKTCGSTHQVKYQVEDIFRIERQGEFERFDKSKYASVASDRRLLWHGSRTTNFGGILSQGLRIAPPEAPVNGYMFDKGIYLADMSSKSANYCSPWDSDGHALLLLCEAELGQPMQVLTDAKYDAASSAKEMGAFSTHGQGQVGPKAWKDAKCIHPSLEGATMPDTTQNPGVLNVPGAYLQYNEYICYDVNQVRLRYLLRVKM